MHAKKKLCFAQNRTPYTSTSTELLSQITYTPFLFMYAYAVLISAHAVNLKKKDLRKKHWLTVKSQICLPVSKLHFQEHGPDDQADLLCIKKGAMFFSFSTYAISRQICDFTYKGWR